MNIAFFWVGQDLTTPTALVLSIRRIYGDEFPILQLTDLATPAVPQVSKVLRRDLSPELMMARLQASQLVPSGERTVVLDADMLVIGKFDAEVEKLKVPLIVTDRVSDSPINAFFPEYYQEFEGKTWAQVMPYLFSFVGVLDGGLFRRLERRLAEAPSRFWRWYGDQWALKQEIDATGLEHIVLPGRFYNVTLMADVAPTDIELMRLSGTRILHFKGRRSKSAHIRTAALL